MATVLDVAAFIHKRTGGVDRLKLQKITYYSQAWTLVWDNRPLFPEQIQAWIHGPVAPDLWRAGRNLRPLLDQEVAPLGNPDELTDQEMENIDAVIDYYNQFSGWQLRELTHRQKPWRDARVGLQDDEPSRNEISHRSMQLYYSQQEAAGEPGPMRVLAEADEEITDEEFLLLFKEFRTGEGDSPDRRG